MKLSFEQAITKTEFFNGLTFQTVSWDDQTFDRNQLQRDYPFSELDEPRRLSERRFSGLDGLVSKFRAFPLEVMQNILDNMVLTTLNSFRQINSESKALVDSLFSFQVLRRHAPEIVQAMVATRAGSQYTIAQVYKTLHTENCEVCGSFGGFIYLVKCSRCCFSCATKDRRMLSIPSHQAESELGLDLETIKQLPGIQTQERRSFWSSSSTFPSTWMVDYTAALETSTTVKAALTATSSTSALPLPPTKSNISTPKVSGISDSIRLAREVRALEKSRKALARKNPNFALPGLLYNRLFKPEREMQTAYLSLPKIPAAIIRPAMPTTLRYLSIIRAPVLHKASKRKHYLNDIQMDMGTHCFACRKYWNFLPHISHHSELPMYSATQITDHIFFCTFTRLYFDILSPMRWDRCVEYLRGIRRIIRPTWGDEVTDDDVFRSLKVDHDAQYSWDRTFDPCLDEYYRESQAGWALGGDWALQMAHFDRHDAKIDREARKFWDGGHGRGRVLGLQDI